MLNLKHTPLTLDDAEAKWREDAQASLAALKHYLDGEFARLMEAVGIDANPAARQALETQRDHLEARLAGVPTELEPYLQAQLSQIDEQAVSEVRSEVDEWSFGELHGREALFADCLREMRIDGPRFGFQWRKRLLDRFDAVVTQ
jgi:hypothetical protein